MSSQGARFDEYSTAAPGARSPQDFANRLRFAMDSRIKAGKDGIDMRPTTGTGQRVGPHHTVYRNFFMDPAIADLLTAMSKRFPNLCPHTAANWLGETYFRELPDKVVFFQSSRFKNEYSERYFKHQLEQHFGKKVEFKVEASIADSVDAGEAA